MPDYRRAKVTGGTYFFTVNTYRRQTFLTGADVRTALRAIHAYTIRNDKNTVS